MATKFIDDFLTIKKSKMEHGSNGCDGLERINCWQGVINHRVHGEITQSSQRIF
jgi:hypothetical protein